MGKRFTYRCAGCGYSPQISGQPDVGIIFTTTTIVCEECQELFDIQIEFHDPRKKPPTAHCPKSARHPWRVWSHPDRCPRCDSEMSPDAKGPWALWD